MTFIVRIEDNYVRRDNGWESEELLHDIIISGLETTIDGSIYKPANDDVTVMVVR